MKHTSYFLFNFQIWRHTPFWIGVFFLCLLSIGNTQAQELYYYNRGEKISLKEDKSSAIIQFKENTDVAGTMSKVKSPQSLKEVKIHPTRRRAILRFDNNQKSTASQLSRDYFTNNEQIESIAYAYQLERGMQMWPTNQVLLRLKQGTAIASLRALMSQYKATYLRTNHEMVVLKIADIQNALMLSNLIYESGLVEWAHPDFFVEMVHSDTPPLFIQDDSFNNDPLFPEQFQMNNTGQTIDGFTGLNDADCNALEAWDITKGSSDIIVAVIDEGVEEHEDLGNVLPGYTPARPNENGRPGNNPFENEHGQACAGIIAALHNGIGVMGVAPNVKILPINIFTREETISDIASAFIWAVSNGADVISNSWGTPNSCELSYPAIDDAIQYAVTEGRGGRGTIVIFASGNGFQDCVDYPANNPNVIAVGAFTNTGEISGYSNQGTALDLVAPSDGAAGVRTIDRMGAAGYSTGNYTNDFGGTSAACPVVSGVAALMLSVNPDLTDADVKRILYSTAIDMGTPGRDNTFGHGRVDAFAAAEAAVTAINTPSFTKAYVKANGGNDNNTGADFDNAFATFQKALEVTSAGGKIYIAQGTYKPTKQFDFDGSGGIDVREVTFQIPDGVEVYGGFVGDETGVITQVILNARNFTANETILSGDIDGVLDNITETAPPFIYNGYEGNAYHVVYTKNVSAATKVDGVTIRGGNANSNIFQNRIGAGWYNDGGNGGNSSPTLINCTFSQNNAAFIGGGMYNDGFSGGNSSPTVTNCTFSQNNTTFIGGGMYNDGRTGTSSPTLNNCTFSQNNANLGGGGMYNDGDSGNSSPTLINCTFSQNNAESGGGMYNFDAISIVTNSIFWENTSSDGQSLATNSTGTSLYHCLIEEMVLPANTTDGGNNIFAQDPLFVDAANGDLRLSCGSPAINAGNNAAIPIEVMTDTDGKLRIQNGTVDMGAYEGGVLLQAELFVSANGGSDSNTGADFNNAFATLQKALTFACAGSKIYIAAGTYKPTKQFDFDGSGGTDIREVTFQIPDGVEVYGGFAGTETGTITQAVLDARNFTTNETILSGDIDGVTDNVTGTAPPFDYVGYDGNAYHVVYTKNVSAATKVDGITIRGGNANGNILTANSFGGGMYNFGSRGNSSPTLTNCSFSQNNRGGMYNFGNGGNSSPTLTNCSFSQNNLFGMYNLGSGGNSSPTLTNCSFSQNNAAGNGGGMINFSTSDRLLGYSESSFSEGTSSPTLTNCSFSQNNAAVNGGGMLNLAVGGGTSSPTLTNCSFSQNNAGEHGGGMYNSGRFGGTSSPQITNSIFWGNTSPDGESWENFDGANPTVNYTLVQEASGGLYTGTTVGSGMIYNQNPLFVNAANGDLRLACGSPALNAGNNAAIPTGITTDIAGNERIQGTSVDMGAYEVTSLVIELVCQNITVELDADGNASITPEDINNGSSDNCGIQELSLSQSTFTGADLGDNTVIFSVKDNLDNITTCESIVTVEDNIFPSQPLLTLSNADETSLTIQVEATDNVGIASYEWFVGGASVGTSSDNPYVLSALLAYTEYEVRVKAIDIAGNESELSVIYRFSTADLTPPVIPVLAEVTGECSVTVTAPTTEDACAGTITGTTSDPLTYNEQGTYEITWTFDDGNGNTSQATQSVVVDDVTAPVITCPADISESVAFGVTGKVITYNEPTFSDNCQGANIERTAGLASDATFPVGTTTVTYKVTDASGNTAECSFTVTITGPVATFTLVNADSDSDLFELTDGQEINLTSLLTDFLSVRVDISEPVGSVRMQLSGPISHEQTENVIPYALFGYSPVGNYGGRNFVTGSYTLTVTPYSEKNLKGTAEEPYTISFTITGSNQPRITDVVLVDAQSNTDIREMIQNDVLDLNEIVNTLSIRAEGNGSLTQSVRFVLKRDGQTQINRIDNILPYALLGNNNPVGNYNIWTPSNGTYELTLTPYSKKSAKGIVGIPMVLNFEVINAPQSRSAEMYNYPDEMTGEMVNWTQLYPNPVATDRVWVGFDQAIKEEVQWEIISTNGIVIQRGTETLTELKNGFYLYPDASKTSNGVYLIRLHATYLKTATKRIVIQR